MINFAMASSFARNALVGAVVSKAVDTFVLSKLNHKLEEKKWVRNKKLELYSKFSEIVLELDDNNFSEKKVQIRKTTAKLMFIIEEKKLIKEIQRYNQFLEKQQLYTTHLDDANLTLINQFRKNLKYT